MEKDRHAEYQWPCHQCEGCLLLCPPSCDSQITSVVISSCALQGPAFPRCLQLSRGAYVLPLAKAGHSLKGAVLDYGSLLLVCHRSSLDCPCPDAAQPVWHLCVTTLMCIRTGVVINVLSVSDLCSNGANSRKQESVV